MQAKRWKRGSRPYVRLLMNDCGVGMRTIQKLMGHKHISTTGLYCDISDEMLRNAVELV
jgi:site-specific recombinase XerD